MNDPGQQARQFTLDEAAARILIADLGIPDDHRLIASGTETRSTFRTLDAEYPYCHPGLNDTAVSDVIRHCHANEALTYPLHVTSLRMQGYRDPQRDAADGYMRVVRYAPGGDLAHCNDFTSNYHGLFGLEGYHGPDGLLRVIREAVRAGHTTVSQLSDLVYPDDPASEAAQQPAKPSPALREGQRHREARPPVTESASLPAAHGFPGLRRVAPPTVHPGLAPPAPALSGTASC